MTPGGYARKPGEDDEESMAYKYSNAELDNFFGTPLLKDMIHVHYLNYIAHIVRRDNAHPTWPVYRPPLPSKKIGEERSVIYR